MLDKYGRHHDVEFNSVPIIKDGKNVGLQGIVKEITDRKRAEEEIRNYSNRLEELVYERTLQLQENTERMKTLCISLSEALFYH